MPVIATAGHVDHGKSTLIRALTGRDPDRWEEEQRRGMTIDLGFAWTVLAGGEVGFVDVPGHERFIKNMLAGVDGIDAAIFVVAADEGWMPQSEEHLAVLDLLGVRRGVVALTRIDLTDRDGVDLAALEVAERLEGTSLEGAPIVPVSAPTGTGLDDLRRTLEQLIAPAVDRQRPRLWVDRSFTIGGAGTVVTGTLLGGELAVGEALAVYPGGQAVRVRGLQTHERTTDRIGPGNRAAVNLSGIERDQVERGAMLGRPGEWRTTTRILADLRTVRSLGEPLSDRGSFHAHIGSGSHPARLSLLEGTRLAGHGAGLITLATPVVAVAGDHVILREVGRRSVVAGGVVLDPRPAAIRARVIASLPPLRRSADRDARAQALLETRGIDDAGDLAADSDGGRATGVVADGGMLVAAGAAARLGDEARRLVAAHHAANPLRAGMPLPVLASALRVDPSLATALVTATPGLEFTGPAVRVIGFTPALDAAAWERVRNTLQGAGMAPPSRRELGIDDETLHALLREGSLQAVGPDLVYLPETVAAVVAATMALPDGFSVGDFRDALGITRKHAIPLLEWMDAKGLTRRSGDLRTPRRTGG